VEKMAKNKQEDIFDAAMQLFAERGYDGTTILHRSIKNILLFVFSHFFHLYFQEWKFIPFLIINYRVDAAMQLFAERGYDGTTIPMIAEKANVGAGTIYRCKKLHRSIKNILLFVFSHFFHLYFQEWKFIPFLIKQEDIFDAAMQLFAERGYDGTTIPMIAEKANVGAGMTKLFTNICFNRKIRFYHFRKL
jgi:hypothetical protein